MKTGSMDNQGVITIYTLEKYDQYQKWVTLEPSLKDTGSHLALWEFDPVREHHDRNPVHRAFSTTSDCWQKYGIKGSLSQAVAKEVATACTKNGLKVRVIERVYQVQAEDLQQSLYKQVLKQGIFRFIKSLGLTEPTEEIYQLYLAWEREQPTGTFDKTGMQAKAARRIAKLKELLELQSGN